MCQHLIETSDNLSRQVHSEADNVATTTWLITFLWWSSLDSMDNGGQIAIYIMSVDLLLKPHIHICNFSHASLTAHCLIHLSSYFMNTLTTSCLQKHLFKKKTSADRTCTLEIWNWLKQQACMCNLQCKYLPMLPFVWFLCHSTYIKRYLWLELLTI